MREIITTYSDFRGNPAELTDAELQWFNDQVNIAKAATGCTIDIIPFDHELLEGKHKDALGTCVTNNPQNPLDEDADTYITIDCYSIHEWYEVEFHNGFTIEDQTLQDVLAHEIAHLTVWRHGKKHTALTEELLRRIKAA